VEDCAFFKVDELFSLASVTEEAGALDDFNTDVVDFALGGILEAAPVFGNVERMAPVTLVPVLDGTTFGFAMAESVLDRVFRILTGSGLGNFLFIVVVPFIRVTLIINLNYNIYSNLPLMLGLGAVAIFEKRK
jgi:hypothetical protein